MENRRRIALIIVIAAVVGSLAILFMQNIPIWRERSAKRDRVIFRMDANGSAGIFYEYEFSRNDILREVDHYDDRFFLNFGPAYDEVWEFEIIGEGELKVNWTGYSGGTIQEDMCFYETYLFKDGKRTKTFDSREAA
ncbi:MAG: hypothetical protein K2N56_11040 [Oscillospiraceae bacterium]|nr:hypothetical protein [Oscillospiraceae bacterium]